MKVAVVGSRSFKDYDMLVRVLDNIEIDEIISGGAKGADKLAERYATNSGIPTTVFKPNWDKFGRAAGMIRNKAIVDASDYVVAFWDGFSRGTADSINYSKKTNKPHVVCLF